MTKNLLRIGVYNICYLRCLFPEDRFAELNALGMRLKRLIPACSDSARVVDWLEQGVYDAISRRYLKTLTFIITDGEDTRNVLECYEFSFKFCEDEKGDDSVSVSLVSERGDHTAANKSAKHRESKMDAEPHMTQDQVRKVACQMIRTLCELIKTFDYVPDDRILTMSLSYHDNVPDEYEPPFFCAERESLHFRETPNSFETTIGAVETRHHSLSLRIRSKLDCFSTDEVATASHSKSLVPIEELYGTNSERHQPRQQLPTRALKSMNINRVPYSCATSRQDDIDSENADPNVQHATNARTDVEMKHALRRDEDDDGRSA
eukprot:gene2052-2748_t